MADTREIKTTLALDGEKAFKAGMDEAYRAMKVFGSEMKLNTAIFGDNAASVEGLTKKGEILRKEVAQQKEIVSALSKAVEESAAAYGESDKRTDAYRIKLNNAEAALSRMEGELESNEQAIKDFGKETADADTKTSKWNDALKKVTETLGKGVVVAAKATAAAVGAVAVAAGAAAVKLGREVVKEFGELEQNLGGADAVFGKYAESIKKHGEEAYKNLGASQSDYLATANKMGALFQGSGIEQQKSLDLTVQAMQRAADMASVMGIDTQVALDSIAGAAKGNFTMMDNLGVAMNATTIQAYALSKGMVKATVDSDKLAAAQDAAANAALSVESAQIKYDKVVKKNGKNSFEARQAAIGLEKAQKKLATANDKVKKAMEPATASLSKWWNEASQAEKAEIAMQMFFEKTTQYAGNFEREATQTISGSIGMMKAATSSFIAGLGNAEADMKKLTGNMIDSFKAVVANITPVLQNIVAALPEVVQVVVDSLGGMLPMLLETVTGLFTSVLDMLIGVLPELVPVAVAALQTIAGALVDNLPMIIDATMLLVSGLANGLLQNLPMIIDAGVGLIVSLVDGLLSAIPKIVPAAISGVLAMVDGIAKSLPKIIKAGIEMIVALVKGIIDSIPKIIDAIPSLIQSVIETITTNLPVIIKAGIEITIALIGGLIKAIPRLVASIPEIIAAIVGGLLAGLGSIKQVGADLVSGLWDGIKGAWTWLKDKVTGFGNTVVGWFKDLFGIQSPSAVMRDLIGKPMVQGVALGITKNAGLVDRALGSLMPDTSSMLDALGNFDRISGPVSVTGKSSLAVTLDDSALDRLAAKLADAINLDGVAVVLNDREMGRYVRKVALA